MLSFDKAKSFSVVNEAEEASLVLDLSGNMKIKVDLKTRNDENKLVVYNNGKIIAYAYLTPEEADVIRDWIGQAVTPESSFAVFIDILKVIREMVLEKREDTYMSDDALTILSLLT